MLKQDLQEVNKNYSELVQAAEEAMKRRKMKQEHNTWLIREREEIEERLTQVQKECNRLQKKAHALDGLVALAEAVRRL